MEQVKEITNIVVLKRMKLRNFRGIAEQTIEFNEKETNISGANGVGKTRIINAFLWALTGKDDQNRADFDIRTRIHNEPLHQVECSVELVLEINGFETTLKREYAEKWVKPRGEKQEVFKGNETKCHWNNVPISIGEYNKKIDEIFPDNSLNLLTRVSYFFELPWEKQRELLIQLAGKVKDTEIASLNKEYQTLLDFLQQSKKTLKERQKELVYSRKQLKQEMEEIQPRIDQTQKLMPETVDFTSLEMELVRIEDEIIRIDKAIADITERTQQQYDIIQKRQSEINVLKSQRQKVLFEAREKAVEEAFYANAKRRELQEYINTAKRAIHGYVNDETSANDQLKQLQKQVEEWATQSDALREEWMTQNATTYNGETKCLCCGQELPDSIKSEALERFNKHKQSLLEEIVLKGKVCKEQIEATQKHISEVEADKANAISGAKAKQKELHDLEEQLSTLTEVKETEVNPDTIEVYQELTQQITQLEEALENFKGEIQTDSTETYKSLKKELSNQRDNIKGRLSDQDRIVSLQKEIEQLEAKGKEKAQLIADIEKEEMLIRNFIKEKVSIVEQRVNNLFQSVSFQLFEYTIEDYYKESPKECCTALVDGKLYTTTNTAKQVNASLEVINVLFSLFGIVTPLFLDRMESVNNLIETPAQIIKLSVSTEEELTIE